MLLNPGMNVYDIRKPCVGALCYDFSRLDAYIAQPDVRKALGVGDRRQAQLPMPILKVPSPAGYHARLRHFQLGLHGSVNVDACIECNLGRLRSSLLLCSLHATSDLVNCKPLVGRYLHTSPGKSVLHVNMSNSWVQHARGQLIWLMYGISPWCLHSKGGTGHEKLRVLVQNIP